METPLFTESSTRLSLALVLAATLNSGCENCDWSEEGLPYTCVVLLGGDEPETETGSCETSNESGTGETGEDMLEECPETEDSETGSETESGN